MAARFVVIYLRYLLTDWMAIHQPALAEKPFVLVTQHQGRMLITHASTTAVRQGITAGMVLADARAFVPSLQDFPYQEPQVESLLNKIAAWCIRFTPDAGTDVPDGIILNVSGCAHRWGGEEPYLQEITRRLAAFGYQVHAAMADTIGAAWAVARYTKEAVIVPPGKQASVLAQLPPTGLRLSTDVAERLCKLGLTTIGTFMNMPRKALVRRFGEQLLLRLDQALGLVAENIQYFLPTVPYQERLPCLEPILTAIGIQIALQRLLAALCSRLQLEGKGLRSATFKCHRMDGKMEIIQIATNHPSHSVGHLLGLFDLKIHTITPATGIELFILEAAGVETAAPDQQTFWAPAGRMLDEKVAQLLDRVASRVGAANIHRYLPEENFWPELAARRAASLDQQPGADWRPNQRPLVLFRYPVPIKVSAPLPDYPPMLFIYLQKEHRVRKANSIERIERAWWLHDGQHRDYYAVEDTNGHRYWLFRSGHYDPDQRDQWYLHGIFA